jgi:hypothetical protein
MPHREQMLSAPILEQGPPLNWMVPNPDPSLDPYLCAVDGMI